MRSYTPGQGSYKVEQAGSLTGGRTNANVDENFGTLVLARSIAKLPARGLDLALEAGFSSDHLYASGVINRIARNEKPELTLMTLPPEQSTFYRIADGWSWKLPWVCSGVNHFRLSLGGTIYDLSSILTDECFGVDAGNESWTEGYHVIVSEPSSGIADCIIVIPEALVTITCELQRIGTSTPHDYEVLANNPTFAIHLADGTTCTFNSDGNIESKTDLSGRNTVTYAYREVAGSTTGVVHGQVAGAADASTVTLPPSVYGVATVGDLITIQDETKVVFAKDGQDSVIVSGAFNRQPLTNDEFLLHKGEIASVSHSDGRHVKFHYYGNGPTRWVSVLLSSVGAHDEFAIGDLFLARIEIDEVSNRLTRIDSVDTVAQSATTTLGADLLADDSLYLSRLRGERFEYSVTHDPDPRTDYVRVVNNAGGARTYRFQKGGFSSHAYNTKSFHQGTVRRGSSADTLIIEQPDFPIAADDWINLGRINDKAFEDVSKDNYMRDENRREFEESAGVTVEALQEMDRLRGGLKKHKENLETASDAEPVTDWVRVQQVISSSRIKVSPALATKPLQNDFYAVLRDPNAQEGHFLVRSSKHSSHVYVSQDSYSNAFAIGDYIFIRHECRKVVTKKDWIEDGEHFYTLGVDRAFSFTPLENEDSLHLAETHMQYAEFSVFYLNKPKVVRIEERLLENVPVDGPLLAWKTKSYAYSYELDGTLFVDDATSGGFTFADVQGPTNDHDLVPTRINLKSTSITTGLQRLVGDADEYTKRNVFFEYDRKEVCKGTLRDSLLRKEGSDWVFVHGTTYSNGRPCRNAGYYGVLALARLKGSVPASIDFQTESSGYRYSESYRFDAWGRRVQTRKSSPSYEGRSTYYSWTQYAVACDSDDVDPFGRFSQNPYSADYLLITDEEKKYCLNLVGAEVEQVHADATERIVYRKFEVDDEAPASSTMNLLIERQMEKTKLASEIVPTPVGDFRGTTASGTTKVFSEDVAAPPVDQLRWVLHPEVVPGTPDDYDEASYDWSDVRFGLIEFNTNDRIIDTHYAYDSTTNVLTTITKPKGNEIQLAYGAGVFSSFITRDFVVYDDNLPGPLDTTQYLVHTYQYDLKGRLTLQVTRFSTDSSESDASQLDPVAYPKSWTRYEYDGSDRLLRTVGLDDGDNEITLVKEEYDETALTHTSTNSLGIRTRTTYDTLYRAVTTQTFKPSVATGAEFDAPGVAEVRVGQTDTEYDLVHGKPTRERRHTSELELPNRKAITETAYDRLGRAVRVRYRNTDTTYGGSDIGWKLLRESVYDDERNSVTTRRYMSGGEDARYVQREEELDWLDRGVVRSHTWDGTNGSGERHTTETRYDVLGNPTRVTMPNGESFVSLYNNRGMLERVINPDGSETTTTYDLNGNVERVRDRNQRIVHTVYNAADLPVRVATTLESKRYSFLAHQTKYCHFGPAIVSTYEDETINPPTSERLRLSITYNRYGSPLTRRQQAIADAVEMGATYAYTNAGVLSGYGVYSGPAATPVWSKSVTVEPLHITGANATEPVLQSAILDGPTPIVQRRQNYLGLVESLRFADPEVRALSIGHDTFLRLASITSDETPSASFDSHLQRDFLGNITRRYEPVDASRVDYAYRYDGMQRLATGENERYVYDEISNILSRGEHRYTYQLSGDGHQMRLASRIIPGAGEHSYVYDENVQSNRGQGNVTSITGRFPSLLYDDTNRLREVTHPSGQKDHYAYGPSGLRFKKTEDTDRTNGDTRIVYTLYQGQDILLEDVYEDTGSGPAQIESWFNIVSAGATSMPTRVAQYRRVYPSTDELRFFANDHLGSCRVVYDATGSVTDTFAYSAYGQKQHIPQTNEFLAHFTGKQYDATGLLYFNARYYDPETGRFLTEDPARHGGNWYQYATGNPLGYVDRAGLRGSPEYDSGVSVDASKDWAMADPYDTPMRETEGQWVQNGAFGVESRNSLTGEPQLHLGEDSRFMVDGVNETEGQPILSPVSGVVERVVPPGTSMGVAVRIRTEEGGEFTVMHGQEDSVTTLAIGDVVEVGDFLMRGGNTGFSTGPHAHVELRFPTRRQALDYSMTSTRAPDHGAPIRTYSFPLIIEAYSQFYVNPPDLR